MNVILVFEESFFIQNVLFQYFPFYLFIFPKEPTADQQLCFI